METSVSIDGSIRGTHVRQHLTYVAKPVSPGVLNGKAKGVTIAGETEMAVSTGEGIGRVTSSGVRWRGTGFYSTSSTRNHFSTILLHYLRPKLIQKGISQKRYGNGNNAFLFLFLAI